ncbi:1,4-dihydroxy-6-naphthoate synthase [Thermoactinomyces mirandus]|uniref:1,4-dihydroxy-6-naphtoate synthase n=1 Tax=Thermoactinomyces mirandus TaxID=2756294 RepID=A0A7W1XRW6_9BACL|nr:1,4-dihydroxy-6-naphthoate synthase [Thermoactinomyces mirandus]MBA4602139.1 1,4-dihydroxy-6-naphthoate synthase [Thermoactinomyces mirandus]
MKIAFSPCPNDTFVFHAWVHGLIPGAPELDVTYADIDITNTLATRPDGPDILKISSAALPWVRSDYTLLPCGGAMGRGCGPLLLAANLAEEMDLTGKRVAVPSDRSTAYLLFRFWAAKYVPDGVEIEVIPFDKIMPAVRDGQFDAGLVIHEARFTYPSYGLHKLVDLGEWWEADTGLPIPLGSIIARRTLDVEKVARWIRASVEYAWAHPKVSREYVMHHAQEMDPEVARQHIQLYVNDFTANLGDEGHNAIHYLLDRAAREGIVPEVSPEILR